MLRAREHAPVPSPSVVFTFGLTVKSIKELGGASLQVTQLVGEANWKIIQMKTLFHIFAHG
jgi:hypothetical protein